jgi:hypothetical protein
MLIPRDRFLIAGHSLVATSVLAQTAREIRGPVGVLPLASEPPAKIINDPPLAEPLPHGRLVTQHRVESVRIVQVFASTQSASTANGATVPEDYRRK